jgi:hypothetical protein
MGTKANHQNTKNDKNTKSTIDEMEEIEEQFYPNISSTVSSTELTGLMYKPPENEEELESYKDLFSTPLPKKQNRKDRKK